MALKTFDFSSKKRDNNRYKQLKALYRKLRMEESTTPKKTKTSLYMSPEDERLLDEVFIKRLRERNKTDRSTIICEGIRLLYEKEIKE